MKKNLFLISILILLTSFSVVANSPKKNALKKITESCSYYKLDNGLSLFVNENHTVPLAYIEIAVKAGAITQEKNTAGLFHLYEHMMFKGNSLYSNSAKVQKALSDMGTGSWNGTTGIECVNYYFTIPSKELENGLKFWNAAIREPLMDLEEFEIEKKVVISEIAGNESSPDRYIGYYINSHLFPDAPWQLDPSGSIKNIENATVSTLKQIQQKYYVPENAALFVGGDVDSQKVFELVNQIFGSWKNNGYKIEDVIVKQNPQPFEKPFFCVIPYDKISPQIFQVNVIYRGPDSDFDRENTYAADMLGYVLNNPENEFVKNFVNDSTLNIPDADYINCGYATRRRTGIVSFSAMMLCSTVEEIPEQSIYFSSKISSYINSLLENKNIVSQEERKVVFQKLKDNDVLDQETFKGPISTLRYNWITNDVDYYLSYNEKVANVANSKIQKFIKKYICNKNPIVAVYVNSQNYEKAKTIFIENGFTEIDRTKAFWWQNTEN